MEARLQSFTTSVVGSLPRPESVKSAFESYQAGRISRDDFEERCGRAVSDRVGLQERAGIDVITDGEQRRPSFVAFLGDKIPGFKLFPITRINPQAEEIMRREKARLTNWRGVAVEKISAPREIACGELVFTKRVTKKPVKITLPSPYLVMWEGWDAKLSDEAYPEPEDLAEDYAEILRREIIRLKEAGADFIQLDEPMLGDLVEATETEPDRYRKVAGIIHGQKYRGFQEELNLARNLVNRAVSGITGVRIGLHMDRWPRKNSPFAGVGYEKLCPQVVEIKVKQFVVEYSSAESGDPEKFASQLAPGTELGVGVVSVGSKAVEDVEAIKLRVSRVLAHLDPQRIWLNPDCGFAPGMYRSFPDDVIERKLRAIVQAAKGLRESYD